MRTKLKRENVLIYDNEFIPLNHVSKALKIDKDILLKNYPQYIQEAKPEYKGFGNTRISHVMNIEGIKELGGEIKLPAGNLISPPSIEEEKKRLLEEYKNSPQYKIDCYNFLKNNLEEQMNKALE